MRQHKSHIQDFGIILSICGMIKVLEYVVKNIVLL